MGLEILKFGGSSVANAFRIRHVSEIIVEHIRNGNQVVVVTSAMQGVTNQLIEMTKQFCDSCHNREYDAVISSGEQVAAGLLAMCLCSIGIPAKSFNAWQIPIKSDGVHSDASIAHVNGDRIFEEVTIGVVPVITGFQGVSDGDIYTVGRGGSDATACAVASAINADRCYIYTDVDGIYTADPRIVVNCGRLTRISYDEMHELSLHGANVLQAKSVSVAKRYGIKLNVVSSFSDNGGQTIVTDSTEYVSTRGSIAGIAHHCGLTIATFKPGTSDTGFPVDNELCIKRISDNTYIVPHTVKGEYDAEYDDDIGLVTIVGQAIENGNIVDDIIVAFSSKAITVRATLGSRLSKSFVVPRLQTELAVNTIHEVVF
ncbi:MAG: aspartate kinase [Holosporales bacterium]|nr:aspartate kinase [Holosporales bacterium]